MALGHSGPDRSGSEVVAHPGSAAAIGGGLSEDPNLVLADRPQAARLLELLAAWSAWPKDGRLPRRSAFDPVEHPRLLPWLTLLERVGHPNPYRNYDLRYRYIGSSYAELFRAQNLTGTHISDMSAPFPQRWFPAFDRVVDGAAPVAVRGKPYLVGKAFMRFELLFLPLAQNAPADGDSVGFVLVCGYSEPATED